MDPQFVKAIHEVDGKPAPNFKAAVVPTESYDGLIIDATEQNFRPALINRVFTPKGELLYDPSKISQKCWLSRDAANIQTAWTRQRLPLAQEA